MNNYKLVYTKQAKKDAKKAASSGLKSKIEDLLEIIEENPFEEYPPYEKLVGSLEGAYSRRINIQHRLVYQVYEKEKVVKVIRMWTHYD
ncbi:MAG: Txe/YoeB family addiction module toxin [Gracilimonas sp.]|uniref:Txe/YoeB family addiction module toxin n=1 Tax=Gracilimonas sp. TaxID=1974203 RepID=UPI001B10D544|nr:Txe/YoeB family addiction module toxin [Gracilimonas sp.]MBO6586153.1 Txe/YoeB family addiction module toxin [Gracilimonas sp.]MBO6614810.1 Txe/YoeB family addiction module toxin [Gracilimonas sp.]